MAYPEDLDSKYDLKDVNTNFAQGDSNIMPFDDILFKQGYRNADESATDSVPDAHNVNWMCDILYRNLRYTKDTAIENKNLIANKKATTTSLGQIKIGQGLKVLSDGTLMLETPITGDKQSITYDIPVGMFMLWGGKTVPDLFIEPTGQIITKTQYPELFQWAVDNYSDNITFSGLFSGTVSSNQCTIKDMRGDFIKIASDNNSIGIHENDSLPELIIENSTHSHSVTSGNGTAHRHSMGSLSYNSNGSLKFVIMNENGNFTASGNVSLTNNAVDTGSTYGFEGDSKCRKAQLNIKTANGSWSGSMDTESDHTHTITINDSGSHTHNITHGAETNNDNKVIPANWGLKLILKAKPSQPVRTVPIGTIIDYTGISAPYGFLIANGITCLKSQFQDLYDWAVQNDVVKPYSQYQEGLPHACYFEGPTSAEFIIPNLSGVYKRNKDNENSNESVGDYEPDGAPDIEGFFYADTTPDLDNSVYTFSTGDSNKRGFVTNTLAQPTKISFNASGANSCYGRKDTIQPKTVITLPILKW